MTSNIFEKGTVYQAKTLEISLELLQLAHEEGFKWASGDSYIEKHNWQGYYAEDTCYNIVMGQIGDVSYYTNNENYRIVQAEDVINVIDL